MHRCVVMKKLPVVVVLGSTGAGKSKLALELAKGFNGEIISTDSMQVYRGLDIVTNKVTSEERALVPHHLLDFLSPLHNTYDVTQFSNTAVPLINDLLAKNKLPVVVGGTNYYIEALLWNMLIQHVASKSADGNEPAANKRCTNRIIESDGGSSSDSHLHNSFDTGAAKSPTSLSAALDNVSGPLTQTGDNIVCAQSYNSENVDTYNTAVSTATDSCEECHSLRDNRTDKFKFRAKYDGMSSSELHEKLRQVDPTAALRYHPHDRRKILTALQVYEEHGVLLSDMYKQQHALDGSSKVSGPLRYSHTCVFWVQCQQSVLDERTNRRVDKMLEQGLMAELLDFHKQYNQQRLDQNMEADYTRGVFQSIGFKEFHQFLTLTEQQRQSEDGQKMLQTGIEDMKQVTRRYARKQSQWVKRRFISRQGGHVPEVYAVDSSDADQWDANVYQPAVRVLQAIIDGVKPELEPVPQTEYTAEPCYEVCEPCGGRVFVTTKIWQDHLNGGRHWRNVQRMRRLARLEEAKSLDQADNGLARLEAGDSQHHHGLARLESCDSQECTSQEHVSTDTPHTAANNESNEF